MTQVFEVLEHLECKEGHTASSWICVGCGKMLDIVIPVNLPLQAKIIYLTLLLP